MLEQELILGRYRVIGKAGAGGYATVQHAFDTHLKRDVAIKCIKITRADVDAAKRTQAMLRQIDPQANAPQWNAPSIPIGSSRVIPAGGHAAQRFRRDVSRHDQVRSVYGRGKQKAPAFGAVSELGQGMTALPQEPSFLGKREERLRERQERRSGRLPRSGVLDQFAKGAGADASSKGGRAIADTEDVPETDTEKITAPRDIPALADMLPGAIKGAGITEIAGIDSNALSINLDLLPDPAEEPSPSHLPTAQGASGGERGPAHTPSFLEAMDADEAARWSSPGASSEEEAAREAYFRNLALGGVQDAADSSGMERPSVAAVRNWQERATELQRREQAARAYHPSPHQQASPGAFASPHAQASANSQAILPEEIAQLDTVPGLEEARTAAHLNDANIVTVYDCVVEGSMAYVIMEYVEGKTLARLLRELGDEVTLDMVGAVFASVSHALEVAHKANVLHLDIKPENVIVNREGIIKVTDFGLSTLMDASGQGKTGGGTIGYMPLEQMRRQPLDVRTDEWALASLTYEMLTGTNPFRAATLAEAEIAIEDAEIILPSRCWDGMDEDVDDVMFTALAPDLDDRFGSVQQMAKALQGQLGSPKEGGKQLASAVAALPPAPDDVGGPPEPPIKGGLLGKLFGRGQDASPQHEKPANASHSREAGEGRDVRDGRDAREERPAHQAPDERKPRSAREEREERNARNERKERPQRAPRKPRAPFIDMIGQGGASIIMRIFASLSAIMISVVALINFRVVFSPEQAAQVTTDVTFGLFSTLPVAAWIVMIALAALAFLKPKIGFIAVYAAFVVSLVVSQAWTAAFLLLAGMGAWWWFFGRMDDGACTLVMMQPLLGSVGFAAVVPVVAGAVLELREAVAAAAAACVSAMVFAALGSGNLGDWEVLANFIVAVNPVIAGASITNGIVQVFANPTTWIVAASWVLGAGAFSAFCMKGTKAFDIMGSVVSGAIIICGMLVVPAIMGNIMVLMPLSVAGAVVAALIGVAFALANVTDRVRMAEGEW